MREYGKISIRLEDFQGGAKLSYCIVQNTLPWGDEHSFITFVIFRQAKLAFVRCQALLTQ